MKKDKIVPVTAEIVGSPNKDFVVEEHMLTPSEVKVSGAATRIEAMEKVFVPVDVSGRSEEFTVTQKPLVMGKDGMDMQDVTVDPAEVIVRTKLKRKVQTATVPVKVSYKGSLPAGLKITSATVNPFRINVFGAPSAVEGMKELELEPVNLETVTKDTTVPVKIILPSGVNTARKTVDIDITVETNSEEN